MDKRIIDPDAKSLDSQTLPCPCCDRGVLIGRHCKRLCENCGYVESCEDNFLPNQANPDENDRK